MWLNPLKTERQVSVSCIEEKVKSFIDPVNFDGMDITLAEEVGC